MTDSEELQRLVDVANAAAEGVSNDEELDALLELKWFVEGMLS